MKDDYKTDLLENIFDWEVDNLEDKNIYVSHLSWLALNSFGNLKYGINDNPKLCNGYEMVCNHVILQEQFIQYLRDKSISVSLCSTINDLNMRTLDSLISQFKTLVMAISSSNFPLSARIVRNIYKSLIVGIALNKRDASGNYILLDSYLETKSKFKEDDISTQQYINRFSENFNDIVEGSHFNIEDVNLLKEDLSWIYPLFEALDPEHIRCMIIEDDDIVYSDIARVLVLNSYDIIMTATKPYDYYSSLEHYFDGKNPVIPPFKFKETKSNAFLYKNGKESQRTLFVAWREATIMVGEFIRTFDLDINIKTLFSSISVAIYEMAYSFETATDSEYYGVEKLSNIKDPLKIENKLEFRNNDTEFIQIIKGRIKVSTDREKEAINEYFTLYGNVFLVSNEVFNPTRKFDKFSFSSENIAIKYMNVFRSLLNGLRFGLDDDIPFKKKVKDVKNKFVDSLQNKYVYKAGGKAFLSNNEDLGLENIITCIQIMCNVCNCVLLRDVTSTIIEAKHLYEQIALKTLLFRYDMETAIRTELNQNNSCFAAYQNACIKNSMYSEIENDIAERAEAEEIYYNAPYTKELERQYKDAYLSDFKSNEGLKYDDFSFLRYDYKNFYDIIKALSNEMDMHLNLVMFNRMYNDLNSVQLPFFSNRYVTDAELSLIILDLSCLLINSTLFDTSVLFLDDLDFEDIIDTVLYMVKSDLAKLSSFKNENLRVLFDF